MRRLWLAFAFLTCMLTGARADSVVVQSCGQVPSPYLPGTTRYDVVDVNGIKCVGKQLAITGGLKTEGIPISKFVDTFNSPSTLDVINWATPTTSGSGTATYSQGQEVLNSGTTVGGALLTSNPTFQINSPALLIFRQAINAQVEIPGTCKQFGLFIAAGSATCAAPVTDGVLFEITSSATVADSSPGGVVPGPGKLQAVTYAGGVRTLIADLSVPNQFTSVFPAIIATNGTTGANSILCPQRSIPQPGMALAVPPGPGSVSPSPAETCPHLYDIWFNGNSAEWDIDGFPVAFMKVGSLGPNNNLLPISASTYNSSGSTATTLKINQAVVGDEGRNSNRTCDATYNFRCATVTASGALSTASVPSSSSSIGITPVVSAAAEASHVLKASAGNLYGVYISNPSASGFLMVFNSATVPGDGAVTPLECVPVSASNVAFVNFIPGPPEVYSTGISAALSSTGCFTKTTSPTGYFHGSVQ